MKIVSARVRNGAIVLDERVELPEGAAVQIIVLDDEKVVDCVDLELAIDETQPGERVDRVAACA